LDAKSLKEKQIEILERERAELAMKTKQLSKRLDHIERAYRKEEIPLWESDYLEQKKLDRGYYNALKVAQLETAATTHAEDLKLKQRLSRVIPMCEAYKENLRSAQTSVYLVKKAEAEALIYKAKIARLADFKKKKEQEEIKKQREEEERARREEEDRARREGIISVFDMNSALNIILEEERKRVEKEALEAERKLKDAEYRR
jgi:translation initiation factor 3 subunit A